MRNSERFYSEITDFRNTLREINKKYAPEYDRLARFQDSEGYAEAKAQIDAKRKSEVDALRQSTQATIDGVVDAMQTTYRSRPASAPTDEQLRLLSMLKLREKLTEDELRQASNSLKDCPIGMECIHELARKNGLTWHLEDALSSGEIQKSLDSMRRNAEHLIANLTDPDDRGHDFGNWDLWRLNRDPESVTDCLNLFGFVKEPAQFVEAVDGEQ